MVGFRNAYVFDVSQTEGTELPTMHEVHGDVGENRDRLVSYIERQGIELVFTENIAPALGVSYGGRILRDAASAYKVDVDAIGLNVKQEFAAKEKARLTKKPPTKAVAKVQQKPAKKSKVA